MPEDDILFCFFAGAFLLSLGGICWINSQPSPKSFWDDIEEEIEEYYLNSLEPKPPKREDLTHTDFDS